MEEILKTIRKIAAPMILLATAISPLLASAQTALPGVEQRQLNQERRIDQGVASGALTNREAQRLERGQQHVENMENRAQADGKVTRGERERLRQAQVVESRRIDNQKHDRQHDFNHDGQRDRPLRRR